MKFNNRSGLFVSAGLLMILLSGCGSGSSTSNTIPTVATVYYAHTALVKQTNNTVLTTGYNGFGQLGNGNLSNQAVLQLVNGMDPIKKVATGADHTLALRVADSSSIYAWGGNYNGEIGNSVPTTGTGAFSSTPVTITFPGIVKDIAAGGFHTLAVVNNDTVYALGYNAYGELGNGSQINSSVPVQVLKEPAGDPLHNIVAVAGGGAHSLALASDSSVYAWGDNSNGAVGIQPNQPTTGVNSFFKVAHQVQYPDPNNNGQLAPFSNIVQIAAGGSTSFALQRVVDGQGNVLQRGTIWAWGYNGTAELGVIPPATGDAFIATPRQITFGNETPDIVKISAGLGHVLALAADGTVYAWGFNGFSQLGDKTQVDKPSTGQPTFVKAVGNTTNPNSPLKGLAATDIIAFGNQSLALVNGKWYGWGDNGNGQLGNPVTTNTVGYLDTPTAVQGF